MNQAIKFTICIPVYNEFHSLLDYISEIVKLLKENNVDFNFSICDDSGKKYFENLLIDHFKKLNVELTYFGWNINRGAALTLYKAANNATGDVLIFIDADGQFLPEDIFRGIEMYNSTIGNRAIIFNRLKKNDNLLVVMGSIISSFLGKFLLNTKINLIDLNCALKIIPKNIFLRMPLMARHLNYSFEMLFYLSLMNVKLYFLVCASLPRIEGLSSIKFIKDGFARLFFLFFLGFILLLIKIRVLDVVKMDDL